MIGPTGAVRVMVATRPVDFRKGAEGLAALVREELRSDPFSGTIYVFRARRADPHGAAGGEGTAGGSGQWRQRGGGKAEREGRKWRLTF